MENREKLLEIAEKVKDCQRCDLYKSANHAVPGQGNPQAKVVFIGEAPGFYEDAQGLPFVGNAGKLLNRLLDKIGLSREDVFIGNIIKHRPPENRDPTVSEIAACNIWLEMQLAVINPKVIATLGRWSLGYFLPNAKISQAHGLLARSRGRTILPLYHPAAALRNGNVSRVLEEDFVKNAKLLIDPDSIDSDIGKFEVESGQGSLF
jgi:uracil-DNA glycosylase family 4